MAQFHTDEYVDFLSRVTPDLVEQAAEGTGGPKVAGLAREMSRCEYSTRPYRAGTLPHADPPTFARSQRRG